MVFKEFKVNAELIYYGTKYTVISIDPPNVIIRRSEGDGEVITVRFIDLVTNPSFQAGKRMLKEVENNQKEFTSILDNITEKERDKVSKRFEMIKPVLILEKVKSNDFPSYYEFIQFHRPYLHENESPEELTQEEILNRISTKNKVSIRTLKRYLSSYKKAEAELGMPGEEGLVSKEGQSHKYRRDNKILYICDPKNQDRVLDQINVRMEEKYIPIIKNVIEQEYLTVKRLSKRAIYESIESKCIMKGISPPKEITIYKLLNRMSTQVRERMRDGKKGAAKYDDVQRGYANNDALYPLHIVEIDHTELDIDVLGDSSYLVNGRPWITLGIDVYSRMIWCLYISFEPPSANRVRKAIQQGIFFKKAKETYNTLNEWEIFGIPTIIKFDNGSEFDNYEIKRLVNETIKSNVQYRPIATPRYGGTIERMFRTINSELIHRLDGTRKSSVTDLGEYDPEKEAALTLNDVTEILTRYITDIYHFEEHKGLPYNQSPMARYIEGLKKTGYPDFIPLEEEEEFKIKLLPTMLKSYTRDGIRWGNRFYKSSELSHLIDTREVKYKVKYDIDDISTIYLQLPKSVRYVELFSYNPPYEVIKGMNQYTFKKIEEHLRAQQRLKNGQIAKPEEVLKAKQELYQIIQEKYKRNRKVRKQAERMGVEVGIIASQAQNSPRKIKNASYQELINRALLVQSEGD